MVISKCALFFAICFSVYLAVPVLAQEHHHQMQEETSAPHMKPACSPEHAQMGHCMPEEVPMNHGESFIHAHMTNFLVVNKTEGPRGREAFYDTNMFMLEIQKGYINPKNYFKIDFMGTAEYYTVPKAGVPLLFQSGEADEDGKPFIDAQHPHNTPVMGLTFSHILKLSPTKKLTFFFAPRGEPTAGPEPFMHRTSARSNPDAPLSHHLQDYFHISSTIAGVRLNYGKVLLEGSTFSGFEPQPRKINLDMHKPDSWAAKMNFSLNPNAKVGASLARVKPTHAESPHTNDEHNTHEVEPTQKLWAIAAWLSQQNNLGSGTVDNTLIWGQVRSEDILNSFLEEFVYNLGRNNFFGRLEVLQKTPDQLALVVTDQEGSRWVSALSLGYERKVGAPKNVETYVGGSLTQHWTPKDWQYAYGGNPKSYRVFMRLNWMKMKHLK